MPQKILGIDAGNWSVKGVLIESSFRGFKVETAKEVIIPLGEPDTFRERQAMALTELVNDEELKADTQIAGYPGEKVAVRHISLPFSDSRRIQQTMEGELEDQLPFDLTEGTFDHQMVEKNKEGSTSLCVATQNEHLAHHLDLLDQADLDPKFLPTDLLQLYNLYTHFLSVDGSKPETPKEPREEEEGPGFLQPSRLIVDIGHQRTLVLVTHEGGIGHARVIRAGGADVTRAIARAYQLSWEDAEAGKHEDALVVSSRHPAATDAAQRMSEVVGKGLVPLVRELRRSIQAIRTEHKLRIERIDLLGGGARIRNLANYLAEYLNVPVASGAAVEQMVERDIDSSRRGAYATALALALRTSGDAPTNTIDLRKGEFAYSGGTESIRQRAPVIAAAMVGTLFLMMIYAGMQMHLVQKREAEVDKEFCRVTKEVIGREICEPDVALSVLRSPASDLGNFKLPQTTAYGIAAELSAYAPKAEGEGSALVITEMSISPEKVTLKGEAPSFDAVDQLVTAYGKSTCFTNIKKGGLRKKSTGEGVEFEIKLNVECS